MKKNLTKTLSLASLLLLGSLKSAAQVSDVSFTVSPSAEYIWWDEDLSIDDMWLYGGKVGFGFGPLVELRGFYFRSNDVDAKVRMQNWQNESLWPSYIQNTKLNMTKYGGEMKLNLWKGTFLTPYLTAGAVCRK